MKFEIKVLTLTPREDEVCDLICTGANNKSIAFDMGIAEGTVKGHIVSILDKLNVDSRLQIAVMITRRRMQCKDTDSVNMHSKDLRNDSKAA